MIPKSEAELADLLARTVTPVKIKGGGTRGFIDGLDGSVVSSAKLTGIELYEPGALTIVAKAGTPVDDIEQALAAEGQRLAFEPMDHRGLVGSKGRPTIGGVVAANVSGPRRVQGGACRDYLLGVRFVDGQGNIIKNGGRVMKNVTGYDLTKLMAGSHGTLGVLTEVSLKVLPNPPAAATISLTGLSDQRAQDAMSLALRSPFDVSGAAHAPKKSGSDPTTMIRVEGFRKSVAYRAAEIRKLLADFGTAKIQDDPAKVATTWKSVRDVERFHGRAGDVWRISVKPTDGPVVAAKLDALDSLYDWGGGLVWALVPTGQDVRASIPNLKGHATRVRTSDQTKRNAPIFQPEAAPIAAITAGLRKKFDPRGILNSGLMG